MSAYAEARYFEALSPAGDPAWNDKMDALDAAMGAVSAAEMALTKADDLIDSTHTSQALAALTDECRAHLEVAKMELED